MFPVSLRAPAACRAGWVALLLSLSGAAAGSAERGPATRASAFDSSQQARVIVKYRSGTSQALSATIATSAGPQRAQALATRLGLALTDGHAMGPRQQVLLASGITSQALAAQLAADSEVAYAVVDGRRQATAVQPDDPLYLNSTATQTPTAGQWYLHAASSTLVSALNAEMAWAITTGSSSLVVADLDTGVRLDHPDLAAKLLPGYDFISDTDTANDGDGRDSDPSDPGDWITAAENRSGTFRGCGTSDSSWHGTQTSGLIAAATNNGIGMAAIGRDVKLLPVRVLGKCGGYDSDIIDAMRWAGGLSVSGMTTNPNPARVINLSLGGSGSCSTAYQEAINELAAVGVVVVAAAGNDGLAVGVPANCSGVVAVAGVRHTGTKVGYSSLGPEVTVAAPAGNCVNATGTCLYPILTTSNTGTTSPNSASYTSGGDDASLGTSFATPLVSGTVGLMLSANGSLTPAQVIALLQSTARTFPSSGADTSVSACLAPSSTAQTSECYCTTTTCGAGLLDARAAVTAAAGQSGGSSGTDTSDSSTGSNSSDSSSDSSSDTSGGSTTSTTSGSSGGGALGDAGWCGVAVLAAAAAASGGLRRRRSIPRGQRLVQLQRQQGGDHT